MLDITFDGPNQGAIVPSGQGRPVQVVLNLAEPNAFYDYVRNPVQAQLNGARSHSDALCARRTAIPVQKGTAFRPSR